MAAVSAPSFGKLIDVYANQGLPFLPGPFWGGQILTRLGKSDDSPLDQIDAIFKKVILIPKSNHLPPPNSIHTPPNPAATACDLRMAA